MTREELVNDRAGACDLSAQDAKGSADYAAHAFKQRDFASARRYTKYLVENVSRLESNLRQLENALAKPE